MPLICPYCRTEVTPDAGETMACASCGTPHHRECYEENGGCTLFGCKLAPPDDPKVHVTSSDVSQAAVWSNALPGPVLTAPTGFGDVNAPVSLGVAVVPDVPPPPPPPPGAGSIAAVHVPAEVEAPGSLLNPAPPQPKARLTFILLGIFLGAFGIHNFYAGYVKRGVAQLALTVLTLFYGSFVAWIWALVEVCTVDRDHNNISFA